MTRDRHRPARRLRRRRAAHRRRACPATEPAFLAVGEGAVCTNFPYDVAAARADRRGGRRRRHPRRRPLARTTTRRSGRARAHGLAVLAARRRRAPRAAARRGRPGNGPPRPVVTACPATRDPAQNSVYHAPEDIASVEHRRWLVIIIVVVIVVLVAAVSWSSSYNGLVRTRNRIDNAWSQIDVQLKRRHDLIPNLVETVKGYAAHEKRHARGGHERAGQRDQRASRDGRRAAGPGGERAERRPEEPVRGRRGVPGPQGEPELPAASRRS